MKKLNLEEYFLMSIRELTDEKFYVPTDMHSSGFNQVEIYKLEGDELGSEIEVYNVSEENEADVELTFNELMEKYPKFTLGRELAYYNKFETWDRYQKALNNEIEITLIEL